MAVTTNVNQAGWFYHAPRENIERDPVLYPPPSQIPGLGCYETEGEPAPRAMYKDTDTKYIRLAKQGGRPDLLHFRNKDTRSKAPVGYPRCDWFYPGQPEAEENKKHEFLLPEYMVNQEYKPHGDNPQNYDIYEPQRGPIAFDKKSAYQREESLTDKTVKLPELIKTGYGVRSGKPLHLKKNPAPERVRAPNTQSASNAQRMQLDSQERPTIQKILSNKYGHEWEEQVKVMQAKQEKERIKNKMGSKKDPAVKSEYVDKFGLSDDKKKDKKRKERKSDGEGRDRNAAGDENQDMRLWNMNRFKNIPCRTDHHMPQEIMNATASEYVIPESSPMPKRRGNQSDRQTEVPNLNLKKPTPREARKEKKSTKKDDRDSSLEDVETIHKILSHRYMYEAEQKNIKIQEEREKERKKRSKMEAEDKSEYVDKFGIQEDKKKRRGRKSNKDGDGAEDGENGGGRSNRRGNTDGDGDNADNKLWYMKRFRNVPSKTEHHMPPEIMVSAQ